VLSEALPARLRRDLLNAPYGLYFSSTASMKSAAIVTRPLT